MGSVVEFARNIHDSLDFDETSSEIGASFDGIKTMSYHIGQLYRTWPMLRGVTAVLCNRCHVIESAAGDISLKLWLWD